RRRVLGPIFRGAAMAATGVLSTPVRAGDPPPLLGSLVGGKAVGTADRSSEVFDPATGVVTSRVAYADAATVDSAVRLAAAAWKAEWRDVPQKNRFAILMRLREL